nr:MAG TPA: hypothetical protein [Caudoviricetes sp.]DAY10956.1 MAG TPA: hypothetical protein [Caudoviricetes sp.]
MPLIRKRMKIRFLRKSEKCYSFNLFRARDNVYND